MPENASLMVEIITGDCRVVMAEMAPDSVDAIVTDPPYELGFMGKDWDRSGVAYCPSVWAAALRVLKPGGHLLAFGGSRTYHRMACAIEDAGFDVRDQIMWLYGSGFPKSLNIGDGRGTALKPAHEPIVLARKPLVGTVAANAAQFGTGALNIDACRVASGSRPKRVSDRRLDHNTYQPGLGGSRSAGETTEGRWPANVIHDGSDEVEAAFAAFGEKTSGKPGIRRRPFSGSDYLGQLRNAPVNGEPERGFGDTGTASRFFYCAKASKADRGDGNNHTTVKPTVLMRYLCRLITPPGGTILDPFTGSGSTGRGAVLEGFRFIGIELSGEYADIARRRIKAVLPEQLDLLQAAE